MNIQSVIEFKSLFAFPSKKGATGNTGPTGPTAIGPPGPTGYMGPTGETGTQIECYMVYIMSSLTKKEIPIKKMASQNKCRTRRERRPVKSLEAIGKMCQKNRHILTRFLRHLIHHLPEEEFNKNAFVSLITTSIVTGIPVEEIKEMVKNDGKTRFVIQCIDDVRLDAKHHDLYQKAKSFDVPYIRAQQGFSREVGRWIDFTQITQSLSEEQLIDLIPVHGTDEKGLNLIFSEDEKVGGLRPMGRSDIHFFSLQHPYRVKSGARKTATHFIGVNCKEAIKNGITFQISGNGVILCSDVISKEFLYLIEEGSSEWENIQIFLSSLS